MSSKSTSKGTKKRKINTSPKSQPKLDSFLSSKPTTDSEVKSDPMQIDTVPITSETNTSIFKKPDTTLTVTIANSRPNRVSEMPNDSFDKDWERQKALILEIFSSKDKSPFFPPVSRFTQILCRFGKAEDLYKILTQEINRHVDTLKKELFNSFSNEDLLSKLNKSWLTFCSQLEVVKTVFIELDRTFILNNTKHTSIILLGKHIFSEIILDRSEFRNVVVAEILKLIKLDRDGIEVDRLLIQAVLNMLLELSYYSSDFEPRFLTSTRSYYKEESNRLIHSLSIPDYIQHATQRRQEELEERLTGYLHASSKRELGLTVVEQLIYLKTDTILSKGFKHMMDQDLLEPLSTLYQLLDQSIHLGQMRQVFGDYIKEQGVLIVKDPKNDSTMIHSLLKFKKKIDKILKQCFVDDPTFSNALKESFEYFINTRGIKPAELLAKFIDSKLKISLKKPTRNIDVDVLLINNALVLFRYIQSKDAFEVYYKRYLAKRLLLDKSYSTDIENHVLEKLKLECGGDFTKNLETMFKDIQTSNDLAELFKEFEVSKPRLPIHVKVIAQAVWPTHPINPIRLPSEMNSSQKLFEKFYNTKRNGKKLIWQNSLSSCSLIAYYPKGNKEIISSLAQTVVLLSFNDLTKPSFTFSEIQTTTGLDEKELIAILKSLIQPQLIINGDSEATFQFNYDFESNHNKIRIPPASVEQTSEEQKEVEKKVQINRQHQLEAAIVRIMKVAKTLTHNDLINKIFEELNYPVEANDIKKRIESLIDRDYINRDSDDTNLYIYQN